MKNVLIDMKFLRMTSIGISLILGAFLTISCQTNSAIPENRGSMVQPFAESNASPKPTSTPTPTKFDGSIKISAVGDMMIGSPFPTSDRMPPDDGINILKEVTSILSVSDIAFGNLEGSLLDYGVSKKCRPNSKVCYAFRMPTRFGKYFKDAGFDVLSLANNHAGDFGEIGRATTRKILDGLGVKHAGSNKSLYSTTYLERKGKRIAFIGFSTNSVSLNVNNLAEARRAVMAADRKADIVVVSFHGGAEGAKAQRVPRRTEIFYGERRGNLRLFARTVINAGADLVIGHGPHVLRGMEIYKGRLVAYSLGNFATYGWFKLIGLPGLTMILDVEIDGEGKFLNGKIHAGKQVDWGIPSFDKTGAAIRKVRQLSTADFGINAPVIAVDGTFRARSARPVARK